MANFTYRVLVVDDDEAIRRVAEAVLAHGGYEVRTAADGFEGLALMRKALPDLIIADLKMPNMSGFEFLSVVRRRFPDIPVIAISGEFVGKPTPEGLLADAFFEKGQYSPEQVFINIRSLLAESPIRPHIPKTDKAPAWIPKNGSYVVLTCTECLRSFSIPEGEAERGSGRLSCIHCGTDIHFVLE